MSETYSALESALLFHHCPKLTLNRFKYAWSLCPGFDELSRQPVSFWQHQIRLPVEGIQALKDNKRQRGVAYQGVQKSLGWLEQSPRHHVVIHQSTDYPTLLGQIYDPPMLFFAKGRIEVLSQPGVAVIGSRQASRYGLDAAYELSRHLSHLGYCITSGLALGIDAVSHQASLDYNGATIAVMANGLSQVYPQRHRMLADKISERGLLISEMPLDMPPMPSLFPRRNRIIAGLSQAVLVVEAAKKSGSLITAELALNEGREVLVVPGSIHSPNSAGCNQLIQQGAQLIASKDDLTNLFQTAGKNLSQADDPARHYATSEHQNGILKHLTTDPIDLDRLSVLSQLDIGILLQELTLLELSGQVASVPGGYCRCQHF